MFLKKIKNNLLYMVIMFSICFLFCFFNDMLLYFYEILMSNGFSQGIHVVVWFLIVWGLLCLILQLINVNPQAFSVYGFIFGFIGYPIGLLLYFIFGLQNLELIPANYTGTSGIKIDQNSNGDGYNKIHNKTYIFNHNNSQIQNELDRLYNIYGGDEYVSTEEFIFWQTGFTSGYDPKFIPSFKLANSSELYLTVGLLALFEKSIDPFLYTLCLLIIPIIGLLFGKKFFFSDFGTAVSLFKKIDQKYEN